MAPQLEPEELETILDGPARASAAEEAITPRDFRRPLRFPAAALNAAREDLGEAITRLAVALRASSGAPIDVGCAHLSEVNAEGLFDGLKDPLVALGFAVGGQPGWALWDSTSAQRLVESLLGSKSDRLEPRALSALESRLVEGVLRPLVHGVAAALGVEPQGLEFVGERLRLVDWQATEGRPDAHRLDVELDVTVAGETSPLHVYLPGIQMSAASSADVDPALPSHLDPVEVELCATLATAEIPLAQLLELEVGDVIPTEVRVGTPALLSIEDRSIGFGKVGRHHGRLAVRIERLETPNSSTR